MRPQLRSVPGVAEVNSFGGFEKQYQVLVRPDALVKYNAHAASGVRGARRQQRQQGRRLPRASRPSSS